MDDSSNGDNLYDDAMSTSELKLILGTLQVDEFGDVCASDELPNTVMHKPKVYIVNTAPGNQPGEHWVTLYFPVEAPVEYFDPLGYPPMRSSIQKMIRRNLGQNSRCLYNQVPVQGPGSTACGQFCIFYAIHRCEGKTMNEIVMLLDDCQEDESPDDIVKTFTQDCINKLKKRQYQ